MFMSRIDRIALLLSLLAVLVTYYVTLYYSEGIPHIEDEIAYVWQAEAIAGGKLTVPSPPSPESFLVPFVVDYDGQRFGKYPLGWPVLLAIGVRFGIRALINPLLAGLGVWLTYRLGKKVLSETVGIIAAGLMLTSPFFLMNSASLLSHPFGLVLSAAFVLAWIDGFGELSSPRNWLPTITAGLTLGVLALTRPLTAGAVAFPFIFHGLYLLWRGDSKTRYHVLSVNGLAIGVGSLILLWQFAITGDALVNPYTLWWSYDKLGFGLGVGSTVEGHNLRLAYINTRFSLWVGYRDLFGWGPYSWVFLPFGLLVVILRRNWRAFLAGAVFPSLVFFYLAYWVGAWLFGPRYYYEGLYSLTLISGVGIAWLAGWPIDPGESLQTYSGRKRFRPLIVVAILVVLISGNLVYYTPMRLETMQGLYGMERSDLKPFQNEQVEELTPALVVVHPKNWMEYGVLLDLQSPFLDTPYIFAFSLGDQADRALIDVFPNRKVYHYYPEDPYIFFKAPR
jgi:hypothetical protein